MFTNKFVKVGQHLSCKFTQEPNVVYLFYLGQYKHAQQTIVSFTLMHIVDLNATHSVQNHSFNLGTPTYLQALLQQQHRPLSTLSASL